MHVSDLNNLCRIALKSLRREPLMLTPAQMATAWASVATVGAHLDTIPADASADAHASFMAQPIQFPDFTPAPAAPAKDLDHG